MPLCPLYHLFLFRDVEVNSVDLYPSLQNCVTSEQVLILRAVRSAQARHQSLNVNKTVLILLLSSDIRSEGSAIAIVKIFDFGFLMIFHSTSLPQSKNVFYKKCVCVCGCGCVCGCVCVCARARARVCVSVCLSV